MKRKVLCFILSALMMLSLALTVSAAENQWRIVDNAELLDPAEESALEVKAQLLRETYDMDVIILTVNTLNGKTPQAYADDYYDEQGYGCGEEKSGVLLLLSMEERDWYISTSGEAIYALTDYGIQCIGEEMVTFLGMSYEAGFSSFLNSLPEYFDAYKSGVPIDGYADYSGDYYHGDREEIIYYEEEFTPSIMLSAILGAIIAGISLVIMRYSMNSKRPQHSAAGYMKENSFHMHQRQDLFLYSNVTKVRRQEDTPSGGGSSVHRSSGGKRHGGGGGKF